MLTIQFNEEGKIVAMKGNSTIREIKEKGLIKASIQNP